MPLRLLLNNTQVIQQAMRRVPNAATMVYAYGPNNQTVLAILDDPESFFGNLPGSQTVKQLPENFQLAAAPVPGGKDAVDQWLEAQALKVAKHREIKAKSVEG